MLYAKKTKMKFRFVEDFETEDPADRANSISDEEEDGPKEPEKTETKFFGKVELHQIAKVDWREVKVVVEREKYDNDGNLSVVEEEVTMYEQVKGELGGWLESEGNLSQYGDCWVHPNGYVMGSAFVYGNAQVKGGAEVGDSATVGDDVVLDGPFGICGQAKVIDSAKVTGKRRMAVFGSAVVSGKSEMRDSSRAYGRAKVGAKGMRAVLADGARAFGNSVVKGTMSGRAEAFGRSEILGYVSGESLVGGTSLVAENGSVSGKITMLKGIVDGNLSGECIVAFPQFVLAKASSLVLKPEKTVKGYDREDEESIEEESAEDANKLDEDRLPLFYNGDVKSLKVGSLCTVSGCTFKGNVSIYHGSVANCSIEDSALGSKEISDGYVSWSQYEIFADGCSFKDCRLPYGEYYRSELESCYVPNEVKYGKRVVGSKMKGCSIMNLCRVVRESSLDGVTVMSNYVSSESNPGVRSCALMESDGPHAATWNSAGNFILTDDGHRKLIAWNDFYKILGEVYGERAKGVKSLAGISMYVYVYDGYYELLVDRADLSMYAGVQQEREKFDEERRKISRDRKKWITDLVSELRERSSSELSEGRREAATVLNSIADFVGNFVGMDWYSMSEQSYESVQREMMLTVNSFDGKSYVQHSDFGILTVDPSFAAIEEKYRVAMTLR